MKPEVKVLTGVLIFSLIMLFGAVFLLTKDQPSQTTPESGQVFEIDYTKGQKIGSESAKVKLVEFSDLQCPACKAYEPYIKQVLGNHGDRVLFVYKHFPLSMHLNARSASNFAEYAATQGKFWEVKNKLFETQEKWSAEKDPAAIFVEIGIGVGLDEVGVREAVGGSLYNQIINDQISEGEKVMVNATPSFYLNGKLLQLQNFSDLNLAVEQELNKN